MPAWAGGFAAGALRLGGLDLRTDERPVFVLGFPERGEGVARGESRGVARVDARDEGIEGVVEELLAEVFAEKIGERQVVQAGLATAEKFANDAELGAL